MGPGNGDSIVWLFGDDLNGFDLNFTWGFYSGTGIWHRFGEGHTHPETEALVFVGLDPDQPEYLGAEVEFKLGKEFEIVGLQQAERCHLPRRLRAPSLHHQMVRQALRFPGGLLGLLACGPVGEPRVG